jgi:hypothetical protein
MSKTEEASLILKLYELRREETMRKARDWYFREFNPQSMADFNAAIFGEHSGHLRMVTTYWDMAAAFVNTGAVSLEMFTETNGEYIGVFAKLEPLLGEIRAAYGPGWAKNIEKLIDAEPDGRKKLAAMRERIKTIQAAMAAQQSKAASKS